MSRIQLAEVFWRRAGGDLVAFASNYSVFVYQRGTGIQAPLWSAEEGGEEVPQPVRTDEDGQAVGPEGELVWVEPGEYDLELNGRRFPWPPFPLSAEGGIAAVAAAIPSVSAKAHGIVGDGVADDSDALQAAIDAAIAAKLPLFLPPGAYRTTRGLVARARSFSIFGAGAEASRIVPDTSDYDALTIGPGAEGSGQIPTGFARDFGIEGGDADVTAAGIAPTSGKAALRLEGIRTLAPQNIYIGGSHDIGFDFVDNTFGCTLSNCRADLNACRVGVNLRSGGGEGAGGDVSFFGCWIDGEVAAVVIGPEGGGYHFYAGQLSSSRGAAADEDGRGTVMIGREYLTGAIGSAPVDPISFNGMDFEEIQHSWMLRIYAQCVVNLTSCRFNASNADPAIGIVKATEFKNGRLVLVESRLAGEFSADAAELLTLEGLNSGHQVVEMGTNGGTIHTGSGEADVNDEALTVLTREELNAFAFSRWNFLLGGLLLTNDGGLQVSSDWGSTWEPIQSSVQEVASAATITIEPGVDLVKVTGAVAIKKINATRAGHLVVLQFSAGATLTLGENLKIGANFVATADDCIALVCDGANWHRVSAGAVN